MQVSLFHAIAAAAIAFMLGCVTIQQINGRPQDNNLREIREWLEQNKAGLAALEHDNPGLKGLRIDPFTGGDGVMLLSTPSKPTKEERYKLYEYLIVHGAPRRCNEGVE